MNTTENTIEFTRINNDTNGNPRYVCHFTNFFDMSINLGDIETAYSKALKLAKKIGGRKFHNKQYGGGIVFQSYNIKNLEKDIVNIRNQTK